MSALIKSITLEEFLELPETKPAAEYFDGQVSQKPMPQGEHNQRVEMFTGKDVLPILSDIDLSLTVEQVFAWLTLERII
jgi:hypothetical protein